MIDGGLSEWNLSSDWVGQIWEDLPVAVPGQLEAYLRSPSKLPFATETLSDVASRVTESITRHLESGIRHLVVVAHQDPVAAAVLHLIDEPIAGLLSNPPPHASVTTLTLSDDTRWTLADRWVPAIG
jgi:broad specificity phosphatase PhoE